MPTLASLPNGLKVAGLLGTVEAIGLAAYGISIIGFELGGSTTGMQGSDLAPGVLVVLYFVFAALIALVTFALLQTKLGARTPFLLIQAFAVVIAQPLVSGEGTIAIGVVIICCAVAAAVACLLPTSGRVLQ